MQWEEDETVFVGVDKIDLQCQDSDSAVSGSITYGAGISAGEAFFVPSHTTPSDCDGETTTTLRSSQVWHSVSLWILHH